MNQEKGFTLIELLVVIAIIGILSSIVLASLNSAREKGQNASALASLSSIRAEAELLYNDTTGYAGVCDPGSNALDLLTAAGEANGQTTYCSSDTDEWGAAVGILGGSGNIYCADYKGFAGSVDGGNTFAADDSDGLINCNQ